MKEASDEKLRLEITRIIRAPRERVFAAFTSVAGLKNWFCPGECHVKEGEMDFRVGGTYRLAIHTSDSGDADLVGNFQEIVDREKLVYTWEWTKNARMNFGQMLVTVNFGDVEGGTEVKITHEGLPGEAAFAGHREGWDGSFDKLDRWYDTSE